MNLTVFWNFVSEADRAYDCHRKKIMAKFSLSAIEVDVLLFLANNPDMNTAADIVKLRKIAKSHVSLAVKSLTEKKLITQQCDEKKRRIIRLTPTPDADEIISFGRSEQKKFAEALSRGANCTDREAFNRRLIEITENLREEYETKQPKD
ncbi:MAG: MarR family winged helix-turn-helix transcriptional regulator [Acutalibacteraceae bacterium]